MFCARSYLEFLPLTIAISVSIPNWRLSFSAYSVKCLTGTEGPRNHYSSPFVPLSSGSLSVHRIAKIRNHLEHQPHLASALKHGVSFDTIKASRSFTPQDSPYSNFHPMSSDPWKVTKPSSMIVHGKFAQQKQTGLDMLSALGNTTAQRLEAFDWVYRTIVGTRTPPAVSEESSQKRDGDGLDAEASVLKSARVAYRCSSMDVAQREISSTVCFLVIGDVHAIKMTLRCSAALPVDLHEEKREVEKGSERGYGTNGLWCHIIRVNGRDWEVIDDTIWIRPCHSHFPSSPRTMTTVNRQLKDWSFTQIGGGEGTKDGEWLQTSQFPTTVHVELLKHKKIPDPFIGLHEWDVQWVGESSWSFKTVFEVTEDELRAPNADLVLDGLDTFASVSLNEKKILSTENQFTAYRASVKPLLEVGTNVLVLDFESAFCKGREIEKQHEKLNLWNGDSSRLHVRKAQYNYGWDWGPTLMTVGPWKPVYLQTYQNRITDLDIRTRVSESLSVDLSAGFTLSEKTPGFASFVLKASDGSIPVSVDKIPTNTGQGTVLFQFEPGKLELWYPIKYGRQTLYTAEVEITDLSGYVLDRRSQRIACRRVRVIQDPLADQEGRTFLFEINNIRIFCGGSNWIPADSFLTTMTPERYKAWLQLLVDGNQNMIRVWGGGIYEHDSFYDTCDEFGILVWQDFMFGCGQYPAYDSFLDSVKEEAVQNVKRLRHHPSIVIFAGNNEDYQIAESLNLELDYSDETSDFRKTNFPARYIYERVLPSIVQRFSDVYYHRSSPYSGFGKDTRDQKYGDLHQWNVWHGTQEPWRNWDILAGRFVSEFGMEGYPDLRTVDYWFGGDKSQRYPQSRVNSNHNKAAGFERRLELYLVENFKHSFEMESYVYYTQVMQSETLASAYRLWRRNWRGKGKEYTAGALMWQLNDCWPTTSWSIVDYFLRPKPAYFAVARELQAYTVGMTRKEKETYPDYRSAAKFTIDTILEIWGTNSTLFEKKATLDVTSFDLHSEWTNHWSKQVVLAPNSSTELFQGEVPGLQTRKKWSEVPRVIIVSARLLDKEGEVLGRYSNWPEPFKFIDFPVFEDVGLKVEVAQDGETVTLSTKKPVKGIVLYVDGEDVKFSDQAIDLVPGDPQAVRAVGLKGCAVKMRFLGDGSA